MPLPPSRYHAPVRRSKTLPCVHSKRPRVYGHHVHMFETCGLTLPVHMGTLLNAHGAVLNLHTGGFQRVTPQHHTTHIAPHHTTPNHDTTRHDHKTTHHKQHTTPHSHTTHKSYAPKDGELRVLCGSMVLNFPFFFFFSKSPDMSRIILNFQNHRLPTRKIFSSNFQSFSLHVSLCNIFEVVWPACPFLANFTS